MAKNRNKKNKAKKGGGGAPPWTPPRVAQSPPHPRKLRNVIPLPPFQFSFRRFQWFI